MDDSALTAGDRFFVITDNDRRGVIWVVSLICCSYVLLALVFRLPSKRKIFGTDDWLALASILSCLLQYILIFVAAAHGLGRSYLDVGQPDAGLIGKLILACNTLLFVTLFLTKCSIIYLCRRLFSTNMKTHLFLCDVLVGVCTTWCLGAILGLAINCGPLEQIGYHTAFCPDLITRWKVVGIIDAATELLIITLVVTVVWPLQMPVRRKIPVLVSFALRPVLIVFIGLHIKSLQNAYSHPQSAGEDLTTPTVYLQVQLVYAIFSAAIPALNRWLKKFDTSMGGTWLTTEISQSSQTGRSTRNKRSVGNTYAMQNMSAQRSATDKRENSSNNNWGNFRPDGGDYTVNVEGHRDADARSGQSQQSHASIDSESKIIRKDVRWEARYDQADPPAQS